MDVRHSEVKDFLRCRKRWDWRWNQGLTPKKQNNKLAFGSAFHKWLDVLYTSQSTQAADQAMYKFLDDPKYQGMDEMEYIEMLDLLNNVTENYSKQYNHEGSNWEIIATELTFKIPLDEEISYTGTIDLIVRDKNDNKIYFLDHKTTGSIDSYDKNSDMDTQISRYWWALQQLQNCKGFIKNNSSSEDIAPWVTVPQWEDEYRHSLDAEIGGFIYNIILKDYPRAPKVLKNGSLSKDKSQNTTYEIYMRKLHEMYVENGVNNEKTFKVILDKFYQDILSHLEQNPREYFRRVNVIRTQSEIDASMHEFYAMALESALITKHKNLIYRNITKDCHWDCAFVDVCKASLDGSDVDFLIEEQFVKEEKENA